MNPKRVILIVGVFIVLLVVLYWFFFVVSFSQNGITVIQKARNPITGEVRDFPTPSAVPIGWQEVEPYIK